MVTRRDVLRAAGGLAAGPLLGAETVALALEPTPFVLRGPKIPLRQVNVRVLADGKPEPIAGRFSVSFGDVAGVGSADAELIPGAYTIRGSALAPMAAYVGTIDYVSGAFPLLLPEPSQDTDLRVGFESSLGPRVANACVVRPARRWSFFLTPHTHFDVGFTQPQPVVFDRLSRDMDSAQQYCEHTRDWPAPSRYRWTVEVAGLVRRYIEGHRPEQVTRFMEWVRQGRIEICGFYLNMPTEITGHEETIRCLYYAQELRRRYGIRIDTVIIDDVPGYAWSLADLFVQAGIRSASFRANSIRGRFLWYRPGAVPRPFYWEGPAGNRLFVWYTDTYRDGNFFRAPGLHEDEFVKVIERNEGTGYAFDEVQLRMGGDNLPPDLTASKNARDWNERYVWPQVTLATNREFLELLESHHAPAVPVHRGDIPSWWADGPGSAALENGTNRLAHDRLAAAETLWAAASLADPDTAYPREEIDAAYEQMIYFDEHTWGSFESIERPKSANTARQWRIKSAFAEETVKRSQQLHSRALAALSKDLAAPWPAVAVWNSLAWPRTDIVELDLDGTPLAGRSVEAVDARTGKTAVCQLSEDGRKGLFVAREIPPVGYAVFRLRAARATAAKPAAGAAIENAFYRVEASPERGGLVGWYDKHLGRELLDRKAAWLGNQPIYEKPRGDRKAICNVEIGGKAVVFDHIPAQGGRLVRASLGPVYQELLLETSLPTCPRIQQRVRIYHELKALDIHNVVTKQENYEPEGVYFAYPFDVADPQFRCEIADASMRPGKDQLTYSCQDYYAIQHWVNVSGKGVGITMAPLEAPLVMFAGLKAGNWADRSAFDNGHVFSWVMNNYWMTNFRAGQSGEVPFGYRLTSTPGDFDGSAVTRFAWQPFYPLTAVWLPERPHARPEPSGSMLELSGDPVLLSCVKHAESDGALVLRLLEVRGRPAMCTVRFSHPRAPRIVRGSLANVVEEPGAPLEVADNAFRVQLRPYEVLTVRLATQGA